jgi:ribosomal protein L11 methylase PrmA
LKFARVVFDAAELERASASLYRAGTWGCAERPDGSAAAAFPDERSAADAAEMLTRDGIPSKIEIAIEGDDPMAAFRAGLAPFDVGVFRIDAGEAEAGGRVERRPGAVGLRIPAGVAFGTGLHESTRAILRQIGEDTLGGLRALDAGCGSAILSIAARARGAVFVAACDLDCDAVFEARRNLHRNAVAAGVGLFAGGPECVRGPFDRIYANMIFEELAPLIPALARLLAPAGRAVFAGIIAEREAEFAARLAAEHLVVEAVEADGEWRSCVARRENPRRDL